MVRLNEIMPEKCSQRLVLSPHPAPPEGQCSQQTVGQLPPAHSSKGLVRVQGQSPPLGRSSRRNNLFAFTSHLWMRLVCDPQPPGLHVYLTSPPVTVLLRPLLENQSCPKLSRA